MKRLSLWVAMLALASTSACVDNPKQPGPNNGTGGGVEDDAGGPPDNTTSGVNPGENNDPFKVGDAVDVNGDGTPDGKAVDDNGDGRADGVDTNGDGRSDVPLPTAKPTTDAGPSEPPMPVADKPCGTDIAFVGGKVTPNLGAVSAQKLAVDPTQPGRYKVLEKAVKVPVEATMLTAAGYDISVEAGELSGTLYAPSEDGSSIATGKRFPLLVGGAGFQASYSDYKGYWTQFASHGIAVLGLTTRGSNTEVLHDKEALENSLAITWLTTKSEFKDSIDASKLGTVGHSKGGKVAFFTAAIDPRIDIAFGWDPSNAGGPPCGVAGLIGAECQGEPVAPNCGAEKSMIDQPEGVMHYTHAETFVFGVPPDALINPEEEHNALNFYRGAPSPADLVYFDGGHASWVESGLAGTLGNADIIRITKTVQTAKLLAFFYGATDLADYLPGGMYLKAEAKVTQVETK